MNASLRDRWPRTGAREGVGAGNEGLNDMNYAKKLTALVAAGFGMVAIAATASAGDSNGNIQAKIGITGGLLQDHTNSLQVLAPSGALFDDLGAKGQKATTDDVIIPSLTLTYYLNKNLAVELFCCAASTGVNVAIPGSATATGNAVNGEVAHTAVFPPVLTLQYHFDPIANLRPYVGVGFEYIHYFNEKLGSNALNQYAPGAVRFVDVKMKDSWGVALQAGVDYDLGGGWSLGVDVKKVWLDTEITWIADTGHQVKAKHDLDPLYITANIGYRFNLCDLLRNCSAAPLK